MTEISECYIIQGDKSPLNWCSIAIPEILESQIETLLLQFAEYVSSLGIYESWTEAKKNPANHITPWWYIVHRINNKKKHTMGFSVSIIDVNTNVVYISVQYCRQLAEEASHLLLRGMMYLENEAHQKQNDLVMRFGESEPLPTTKWWPPLKPWWPRMLNSSTTTILSYSPEILELKEIMEESIQVSKKAVDAAIIAKIDRKIAVDAETETSSKAKAAKKAARVAVAIANEASTKASTAFIAVIAASSTEIKTAAQATAAKAAAKSIAEIEKTKVIARNAAEVATAIKNKAYIAENLATAKKEAAAVAVKTAIEAAAIAVEAAATAVVARENVKTAGQFALHKQLCVKTAKDIYKKNICK